MRRTGFRSQVLALLMAGAFAAPAHAVPPSCPEPGPVTVRADHYWEVDLRCGDSTDALVDAGPAHGTLEQHVIDRWSALYRPHAGYVGEDAITYRPVNASGAGAPVTQRIVVDPAFNRAPWCRTSRWVAKPGRTRSVGLDCFDPDADELEPAVVTPPAHGAAAPTGPMSLDYTADAGYEGEDAFTVRVRDRFGAEALARVEISVTAENQRPVCQTAAAVIRSGRTDPLPGWSGCYDDDGDALTFSVARPPEHGIVHASPGTYGWRFTAHLGYAGTDEFTMRASDGELATEFTVLVRITESFHSMPECADFELATRPGRALRVQLQCFDRDLDPPQVTIAQPPHPATGRLDGFDAPAQTVRFTPADGFTGLARFRYRADDLALGPSPPGTVWVSVTRDGTKLPIPGDVTAPALGATAPKRLALRRALARGVEVAVELREAATVSVAQAAASRLRLAQRPRAAVVVGRKRRELATGSTRLRVRPARRARVALRRAGRVTLRLATTVADASGNRRTIRSRVALRGAGR